MVLNVLSGTIIIVMLVGMSFLLKKTGILELCFFFAHLITAVLLTSVCFVNPRLAWESVFACINYFVATGFVIVLLKRYERQISSYFSSLSEKLRRKQLQRREIQKQKLIEAEFEAAKRNEEAVGAVSNREEV